jgi:helix-turn-helix protein
MTTSPADDRLDALKEIPPLMPQFLRKRRAGLPAAISLADELDLDRATFFTLVQLQLIQDSHGSAPLSLPQIRAWSRYIYSTVDSLTIPLTLLTEKGLVLEHDNGTLSLSPRAVEVVARVHAAGRAHVARLQPLPPDELELLAVTLQNAVDALMEDPVLSPRPGSQLAGSRALAASMDIDAPPMVRIEQAIHDLWMARDDAHIKAWRDAEMEGPPMQVLTVLWLGEAGTTRDLAKLLQEGQTPDDLEGNLIYLTERELVMRHGDDIQVTPQGVIVRDDIERETDRIYFASWPHTLAEARWLRDKLQEVVDNIPTKR